MFLLPELIQRVCLLLPRLFYFRESGLEFVSGGNQCLDKYFFSSHIQGKKHKKYVFIVVEPLKSG